MTEGTGIHKAICAIKAQIAGGGGITKDRRAPMGYAFRGIEDFDNILCGMTAEHGVNAYPRILKWEVRDGLTDKGKYQSHAFVEIEWTYVCSIDNSKHVCSTVGEAMDTQDKALNKAMQAARKYADIMVFRIPVAGDDSEVYVPNPGAVQRPPLVQTPPPGDPMAAQISNGTLVPTQAEPQKRTRGPNKPKEPPPPPPGAGTHVETPPQPQWVPPQQQVVTPQPVPANYPLTPARTVDMVQQQPPATPPPFVPEFAPAPDANGNVYAPASPEDATTALMGRIGEVNSFTLLYAIAQDADSYIEPGRSELMTAVQHRGVYLFGEAKNLSEVQEGFTLVSALGQPLELKKAANEAYAKYRRG